MVVVAVYPVLVNVGIDPSFYSCDLSITLRDQPRIIRHTFQTLYQGSSCMFDTLILQKW
jgi:hypothetical protein